MRVFKSIATLVVAAMLCSCEFRPLLEAHNRAILRVHLVTDNINNVTTNIYNPDIEVKQIDSDMFRALFYSTSDGMQLSQGLLSNKSEDENGHTVLSQGITIDPGTYRIVGYNFDLRDTYIAGESNYHDLYAYTTEIAESYYSRFGTRADEIQTTYYQPEHIMVASEDVTFTHHSGEKMIDIDAHPLTESYYIQIRITGQKNMAMKAAGMAVISGMSPTIKLADGSKEVERPSSIFFELEKGIDRNIIDDTNQDVLCAVFNTFGRIEESDSELTATLSVLTRDGNTAQKVIDLTPYFKTEDAIKRHWLLIEDIWDIPEPIVPDNPEGGGWSPNVDDWDDIDDYIYIGGRQ